MKKLILGVLLIGTFGFTSCSNDVLSNQREESNTSIVEPLAIPKTILNFESSEDIIKKVDSIKMLKQEKERVIFEKILLRNNLTLKDLEEVGSSTKLDKEETLLIEDIKKDVIFYHKEMLNSIHELRSEIEFTSIQSIADEINFLKLLNKKKSDSLFNKYRDFLTKDKFLVYALSNSKLAEVSNLEGKLLLNKEEVIYNSNKKLSKNHGKVPGDKIDFKTGILVNNSFFAVTYHAGWREGGFQLNDHDFLYSELRSFITVNGTYLPYPCVIQTSLSSKSYFYKSAFEAVANIGAKGVVSFNSVNSGIISSNEVPYFNRFSNEVSYAKGHVTGICMFPASGSIVTLIGSKDF